MDIVEQSLALQILQDAPIVMPCDYLSVADSGGQAVRHRQHGDILHGVYLRRASA
jgi:hypothetical protein